MQPNDQRRNVFGIFTDLRSAPFAMSRWNWKDSDYVVVIKVIPKANYGVAHGFPVHNDVPNDHFKHYREWETKMVIPNAGAYQWRVIDVSTSKLHQLIQSFQKSVAPNYEFGRKAVEDEEEFL